jgi:hypothetical protein
MGHLWQGVSRSDDRCTASSEVAADGHLEVQTTVVASCHLRHHRMWPQPHDRVVGIVQDQRILDDEPEP